MIEVRIDGVASGPSDARSDAPDGSGNGEHPGDPVVSVTFSIPARSDIATAAIVGDFNGWSATDAPMRREDDVFTRTLGLRPGRRYRFKYLVNGDQWENDWAADDYEPNYAGGDDSVVDLTRSRPVATPAPGRDAQDRG